MASSYDVVVIGGGPGGYVAAIRAAQLKMKTAVIERDKLGGICLNWGCIPTKALLKNAEIYDKLTHGAEWGIKVENPKFDFERIIKRSRGVADRMASGIDFLMKKNKITTISGTAKLLKGNKVEVTKKDGKETVEAKHIIVATGARPKSLPGVEIDGDKVIAAKEAMSLKSLPKSLTVVGAGAIGIEFAYFYAVLGTKVTVIEYLDSILPVEDREASKVVAASLKKRGVNIVTGAAVKKVEATKSGTKTTYEKNGKSETVEADKTLMAVGVTGNVEDLGLEDAGVEVERGAIKVDKADYSTTAKGIYAIGDVAGPPWLAHVASGEAIHCLNAIAGLKPRPIDYSNIPGCTYCQPQVASVGMTEEQLKEKGIEYKVGKFPFTAAGKAVAAGEADGFVKILFGKKYGEILGGHIVGSEATELIAEVALAKSMEATLEDLHNCIHAHPTLSEAVMEAAGAAENMAVHI